MKKIIFGRKIMFIAEDEVILPKIIERFALYSDFNDEEEIRIHFGKQPSAKKAVSANPAIHTTTENGFSEIIGNYTISYTFSKIIDVYVTLPSPKNSIRNIKRKMMSREFTIDSREVAAQILYELVLVPMTYIYADTALVHSSGFTYNGKTFLLGGTGGTGKTTASLAVAQSDKHAAFLNDDISIIDEDGYVYPNLAYPKIYAYNAVGEKDLEKQLLENETILGKLQWRFFKKVNPKRVRRKISPRLLFDEVIVDKTQLDYYLILFREDCEKMELKPIDKKLAIDSTILIMQSEYGGVVNNHLLWNEYNRKMLNLEPIISLQQVAKNWEKVLDKAFENKPIYKLSIPLDIKHHQYKKQILEILNQLSASPKDKNN